MTMVLRILKVVVVAEQHEVFRLLFAEKANDYFRAQPGNVGMYLMRDAGNPMQYFVHTYWESEEALRQTFDTSAYANMLAETVHLFHERPKAYECLRIREDPRVWQALPATGGCLRVTSITADEQTIEEIMARFDEITDRYSRVQPGCHGIELFQVIDKPTQLWMYSFWASSADFHAYLNSEVMAYVRETTRMEVVERTQSWHLKVVEDDPRRRLLAI